MLLSAEILAGGMRKDVPRGLATVNVVHFFKSPNWGI